MKIILEVKEVLEMVHSALCNGGLSELRMCDVELDISQQDYQEAKDAFLAQNDTSPCIEDVYVQILKNGKAIKFFDHNEGEEKSFTLEGAIKALSTEDASDVVLTYKNEGDDAYTAVELLQHCLYGEVLFG
jgi:hypothetical protein